MPPPGDKGTITVEYPYFETPEPQVFDEQGTYVESDVEFATTISHSWNHGLAETITALMRRGLELTLFEEHTTVPWKGLDHMVPADIPGEFTLPDRANRVAMSYTIVAEKRVS